MGWTFEGLMYMGRRELQQIREDCNWNEEGQYDLAAYVEALEHKVQEQRMELCRRDTP